MTAPPPLVIVGATATGKTALAVALARRWDNVALVNADSRQVVSGLRVGTAAPTREELQGIPYHCLDLCEPGERFTVVAWLAAARVALSAVAAAGSRSIVVGGTGLYVDALVNGFAPDIGEPDQESRAARNAMVAEGRFDELVAELQRRDPSSSATIDLRNPRRVIRTLEILDSGRRVADVRRKEGGLFARVIGLEVARANVIERIEARARRMFESGALLAEVDSALGRGIDRAALARCGIGYAEALSVHDGETSVSDAVPATVRRTVRYAKAQRTWFRRDPAVEWIDATGSGPDEIARQLASRGPKHPFAQTPVRC